MSEAHDCGSPGTESDAKGSSTIEDVSSSTFSCGSGSCSEDVVEECKTSGNAEKRLSILSSTCSNTDNVSAIATTTVTSRANGKRTFDQKNSSDSVFGNGKIMLAANMDVPRVEEVTEIEPRDSSLDVPVPLHVVSFATDKDVSNLEECTEVTFRNNLGSVLSKSDIPCVDGTNVANNEECAEAASSEDTVSADSESDLPFADDANIQDLPLKNTKIACRDNSISVLSENYILSASDMGITNFKKCAEVASQNDSVNIEVSSSTDLFFPADMNVANFEECVADPSGEYSVSISSKCDAADMNVANFEESTNIATRDFSINVAAVPSNSNILCPADTEVECSEIVAQDDSIAAFLNSDILCPADIQVANFEECSDIAAQYVSVADSPNSNILFPADIKGANFEECIVIGVQDDSAVASSNSDISFVDRNVANFEECSSKPALRVDSINIALPSNIDILFPVDMEVVNFEEYPPDASRNDSVSVPSENDISYTVGTKAGNFEECSEGAAEGDSITASSNSDSSFLDRNVANFEEYSSEPALLLDSINIALPSNNDILFPVDMEVANFEEYPPDASRNDSVSVRSKNDISYVDDVKVGNFEECSEVAARGDSVPASSDSDILFPVDMEVANFEECSEFSSRDYSINFVIPLNSIPAIEGRMIRQRVDIHQVQLLQKEFPNYDTMVDGNRTRVLRISDRECFFASTVYANRSAITANQQDSAVGIPSSNTESICVVTYMYIVGTIPRRTTPSVADTENSLSVADTENSLSVADTENSLSVADTENSLSVVPSDVPEVNSPVSEEEHLQCSICFDAEHAEELERTPCGHRFHKTCLRKWLLCKQECPICRNRISTQSQRFLRMIHFQTSIRENDLGLWNLVASFRRRTRRDLENMKRNLDSRK